MFADKYKEIFGNKIKIMGIFAHPDDAEIYAGGTIARLVEDNKEVIIVKMSLGNKGSRQENISEKELKELRMAEDKTAMAVLGIKKESNVYLDISDGSIDNSLETIEKIAFLIRKHKPDIVITHNPENIIIRWDKDVNWVNHRDHRNTGKSVVDACYPYSRDILFFPEQFETEGIDSHSVTEFLFVDYYDHQDTVAVDVTKTYEIRTAAIAAHNSQYTLDDANNSTDFFTKLDGSEKRYERFRYVIAD